jgi:coenzyme PQQ precursor peptide PqqA
LLAPRHLPIFGIEPGQGRLSQAGLNISWRFLMSWSKPVVCEVCIGLEINDYFPAEI